ncbi:RtcB family protein [Patescibacteria group bacterium]
MTRFKLIKTGINKYKLAPIIGMKADAFIYSNEGLLNSIYKDSSLEQLYEASTLTNIVSPVIGMPDIHEGFGLPIGGIMATTGLISVGAVGMDINCGVRLLTSPLTYEKNIFSEKKLKNLINQIETLIPVGLGGKHKQRLSLDLKKVTEDGVLHLVKKGYTPKKDLARIEEYGRMQEASYLSLSPHALKRAIKQVGTLGSGNHFIEIQKIEKVYDPFLAEKWGISDKQIAIMVHSGSRALGHQTCLDFTNLFWQLRDKYKINVPKKGLASLPIDSPEGKKYFSAMAACVNFAFCNRAMMTYFIRQVFNKNFNCDLNLLYDVAHNIAKWENHQGKWLLIHRKGATRALPPNHPQNPKEYKETGHPAIVPGSMGTASYIMVGLPKIKETYCSINHGAGRVMSRTQAKKQISEAEFKKIMGNIVYNKPFYKIADEAPQAYKNIKEVINTLVKAGLTKKVAKLVPLAVIKGD